MGHPAAIHSRKQQSPGLTSHQSLIQIDITSKKSAVQSLNQVSGHSPMSTFVSWLMAHLTASQTSGLVAVGLYAGAVPAL